MTFVLAVMPSERWLRTLPAIFRHRLVAWLAHLLQRMSSFPLQCLTTY